MTAKKYDLPEEEPGYGDGPVMDIEDHEYDSIRELNNPSPGWIMAIFYLTIGFSILYGAYYFWLRVGDKQDAEYAKAVEKARIKYQKELPGGPLALLTDEASISAGKGIFISMNCATCHGTRAEGNVIGPNLTDNYWLHGCKFEEVFNLIKNGFPTKGMTAFKTQLSDEKIQQVTSYVVSLIGSNPANAKAPQGVTCE